MNKIIAAVLMAVSLVACGGHQQYQNQGYQSQGMQYNQGCDPTYTDCSQVPQGTMGYYDNNHGFHWGSAAVGAAAGYLLARHHYNSQLRRYHSYHGYGPRYSRYGGYHTVHVYHYHFGRRR